MSAGTRESALPWDRIGAARYTPEPGDLPVVSMVERVHEERVAHNPDIAALQADVDALKQLRSQRDVSLNFAKRRGERDVIDAERVKRENERRTAPGLEPLADVAALDKTEAPDAVLDEAIEIAADSAELPKAQAPAQLS